MNLRVQTESVCPITSLPITTRPEWTDIRIGDDYSVSFKLLGNAILWTIPKGTIDKAGTRALIEAREKVLVDTGLKGKRYAEIRDHAAVSRKPSKTSRMILTRMLLKETNEGNLMGFWVFDAPLPIKLMFSVGVKLYKPPVPVGTVKSYREAAENAVHVLEKNGVNVGSQQYERFTKNEWGFELGSFSVRFELIGEDIVYSASRGSLTETCVHKFFDLHQKILEETGITAKGSFYRVLNWENLERTSWKARRMYIDGIKDLNRKTPCKLSVLFGLNGFMRTIIGLSKPFIPFPVTTSRDFKEAMAIIESEKRTGLQTGVATHKKRTNENIQDKETGNYCDELLEFIGTINWDREGMAWENIRSSHPFKPVFDAIAIIKEDVDDLFRTQKQIEASLARKEKKYRDIFENVSDFIYIHDLEGNFTETNLAWKQGLGLTENDLSSLNVRDLLPARYKDQFADYLNRVKTHGKDEGLMCVETKAGREYIIEYRNSLIRDATGPVGVRGSARDITRQVSAQRALKQSEKRYRNILENIEDGYFEVDLTGSLTFFNDALCRIIGLPESELMGVNNREYMDEETAERVYKAYTGIFQTGVPIKGLEYTIRKDGIEKDVETSVSLMKGITGRPVGFRGIIRDVSERKRTEEKIRQYSENLEEMVEQRTEALRKSEEKYRTILESIEDGYYEVDLAGNLTFFNSAACRITGYPENELMGMNSREYTNEEDASKLFEKYNEVYKTGVSAKRLDWKIVKKDGTAGFMETSISPIAGSEGRPVGFRGILRDVTERRELERQIILKGRLSEKATRAKSEFLANMSHEIRTPLNGIIGMAELALETNLDDNQKNIFHTINTEAGSLQDVINEILDFSKIEAGKLDLEEIPFDLRVTIEDIANGFTYRAEQKGLNFNA
ncbi:MAG: PAS domain S-box protein, partial [Deltaproteobacteria bacterium]|nr:PAS domain S-box protein [Deltaproteobacteria bacterium]